MKAPFSLLQLLLPKYSSPALTIGLFLQHCCPGTQRSLAPAEASNLWPPVHSFKTHLGISPILSKLTHFWHLSRAVPAEANCTSNCKSDFKKSIFLYTPSWCNPPCPQQGPLSLVVLGSGSDLPGEPGRERGGCEFYALWILFPTTSRYFPLLRPLSINAIKLLRTKHKFKVFFILYPFWEH